jgi:type II secretory pathway predicted ATPase ExeA
MKNDSLLEIMDYIKLLKNHQQDDEKHLKLYHAMEILLFGYPKTPKSN